MQKKYGLIGYPLTHSFSQKYFTEKFKNEKINGASYHNFSLNNIHQIKKLLQTENNLVGLNVTIPYKEKILLFLDEIDETAAKIGAVNTIQIKNGRTKGYNTDVVGFEESLVPLLQDFHKKALILGTGGAAKAVAFVLNKLGIGFSVVSRTVKKLRGFENSENVFLYQNLSEKMIKNHHLIINTTPLGTYPKTENCPNIPYQFLGSQHLLYDLVYNPETTLFMKKGQEKGAKTKNGYEMLVLQAEAAYKIWNNTNPY